jgi:hypothetical protein
LDKLEKIVSGADDCPFGPHLLEAAEQKLAESARVFNLSEHRLGQFPHHTASTPGL